MPTVPLTPATSPKYARSPTEKEWSPKAMLAESIAIPSNPSIALTTNKTWPRVRGSVCGTGADGGIGTVVPVPWQVEQVRTINPPLFARVIDSLPVPAHWSHCRLITVPVEQLNSRRTLKLSSGGRAVRR